MSENSTEKEKRIAFIHPDLGIGGAERLVVDAAVSLQELGHKINVYTSHCDKSHCFEEVSSGLLKVQVYGDFLPSSIAKKFHIFFAILRQFYLVIKIILTGEIKEYDYFIVDQLSFCIPFLHFFSKESCRVLFYCHFPDQLLAKKGGFVKSLYRVPFDYIEEATTGYSDKIVVNSNFTKGVFHRTFKRLEFIDPGVIYPCIDPSSIEITDESVITENDVKNFFKNRPYFVSINRFEKKKNIELAIKAFAEFKKKLNSNEKVTLVVAGGYDARVLENVEYLDELVKLSDSLGLKNFTIRGKLIIIPPSTEILFLPSVSSSIKNALVKNAQMLFYTPSNEHFGIVPVEGMLMKTPVLTVNNGGPLESIINFDGKNEDTATGFNIEPDHMKWCQIMSDFYLKYDETLKTKLGNNGFERANSKFSRTQMGQTFFKYLLESSAQKKRDITFIKKILILMQILMIFIGIYMYKVFT